MSEMVCRCDDIRALLEKAAEERMSVATPLCPLHPPGSPAWDQMLEGVGRRHGLRARTLPPREGVKTLYDIARALDGPAFADTGLTRGLEHYLDTLLESIIIDNDESAATAEMVRAAIALRDAGRKIALLADAYAERERRADANRS